jgi:hypothetical protein
MDERPFRQLFLILAKALVLVIALSAAVLLLIYITKGSFVYVPILIGLASSYISCCIVAAALFTHFTGHRTLAAVGMAMGTVVLVAIGLTIFVLMRRGVVDPTMFAVGFSITPVALAAMLALKKQR